VITDTCYVFEESKLQNRVVDCDPVAAEEINGKKYYIFDKYLRQKDNEALEGDYDGLASLKPDGEIIRYKPLPCHGGKHFLIHAIWDTYIISALPTLDKKHCSLWIKSEIKDTPSEETRKLLVAHTVGAKNYCSFYPQLPLQIYYYPVLPGAYFHLTPNNIVKKMLFSGLPFYPTFMEIQMHAYYDEDPKFQFEFSIVRSIALPFSLWQRIEDFLAKVEVMLENPMC